MSKVRVWDLPTRVFHWALAACVVGLVATGQIGGDAMVWHFRLGYTVLTLVLFRLVWGVVGGYWSRFTSFVPSPSTLIAYLKSGGKDTTSIGHNPLGSLSVLGLLGAALVQVSAGLMSDDEILATGPLVSKVPPDWVAVATFFHTEVGKLLLIGLVALHVAAIAWYRFKKNENLVRPMLVGDKEVSGTHASSRDDGASRLGALVIFIACGLLVAGILRWAQ
jgi:cytochrome b